VTEIEGFLFRQLVLKDAVPFLRKLSFINSEVSIELVSFPDRASSMTAVFSNAVVESLWFDEDDPVEWPLDIIGFESYQSGAQHRFVLNCSSVEWGWRSDWPVISVPGALQLTEPQKPADTKA
jgi:hypothetical protein